MESFYIIEEIIKNELPRDIDLVVYNTICQATEIRQKETKDIAKKVNTMIIIGGKNSSNTKKLYNIASKHCEDVEWVENANELKIDKIKVAKEIGIMAGASTPKESIDEVIKIVETCDEI